MDVGWDKLVFFLFGDHELIQYIGAFVTEVVGFGFKTALFQECLDFDVCGKQTGSCPSFQRLGEDFVGIIAIRD